MSQRTDIPIAFGELDVALLLGFFYGLYCFFKGFRIFRRYRLLADTPEAAIRSAPMGLVEIQGRATGTETVLSPVSRTPCFFYKVNIDRWEQDSERYDGHWTDYLTDTDGVHFYLEDSTGRILVDPHEADLELAESWQREIGHRFAFPAPAESLASSQASAFVPPTDEELHEYIRRVASGMPTALFQGAQFAPGTRHDPHWGKPRPKKLDVGKLLKRLAKRALGGGPAPKWEVVGDRYRLTEYCIVSGEPYDIAGTCMENPQAQSEDDHHLIAKGKNDPTFSISYGSAKQQELALRWRALKYIFGGAALCLACIAMLGRFIF